MMNLLKLLHLRKIKPITSSKNMLYIADCRKMEYYDFPILALFSTKRVISFSYYKLKTKLYICHVKLCYGDLLK